MRMKKKSLTIQQQRNDKLRQLKILDQQSHNIILFSVIHVVQHFVRHIAIKVMWHNLEAVAHVQKLYELFIKCFEHVQHRVLPPTVWMYLANCLKILSHRWHTLPCLCSWQHDCFVREFIDIDLLE